MEVEKYFYKDIQSVINDYLMPSKDEIKNNYKLCMRQVDKVFHYRLRGIAINGEEYDDNCNYFEGRKKGEYFIEVFDEIKFWNFYNTMIQKKVFENKYLYRYINKFR
jgi:hypothetical protein